MICVHSIRLCVTSISHRMVDESLTVDAHEERCIEIADVAGAFLRAEQNDYAIVKFKGPAVDALLSVSNEKYHKYGIREKI